MIELCNLGELGNSIRTSNLKMNVMFHLYVRRLVMVDFFFTFGLL